MTTQKPSSKTTKSVPVFLNAKAGAFKHSPQGNDLVALAHSLNLDITVVPTNSIEDLHHKLQAEVTKGTPRVIIAGGDGTVAEAVQVLAYSNVELGIIPTGTANNFATALRLPMDLPSALRVIKKGAPLNVSLGKAGNRYFTEAAGVGLFADALALFGQGRHTNLLKAFITLIRVLLDVKGYNLTLEVDGTAYSQKAVMCTIANTFRIGYALPVAPEARLTENSFEVVVFGDIRRREFLRYFRALRSQLHPSLPKVTTFPAKNITIKSHKKLNVHIDDAVVGTTPLSVEIQPNALTVLVDKL